ncbi:EamA family transporter [Halobacteriales archaeon QH_10_65_19]|nr:MAG: EamA family transporter [Halobacteriales archaeon QH_10_65_19]
MRFRNAILFVGLAVAWGSAFTAIKAGLEFFPPVLFAAFRYDLAGVLMLGYAAYVTDRWIPRSRNEWVLVGISGTLMIAAYHVFLFTGEQGTTSAAAAIIVSLSPILTTGFARALLPDERLTFIGIVGLLVGFAGVVILSNPDPDNLLTTRTVSMFLIFVAAAAFALGSVLTRRVDAELPVETMEAWSMLIGAVLMHGASIAIAESVSDVQWTGEAILALLYLVVVASALGFLIYFDLLNRLGPIEINLVSYAAPVVAAVTGLLFLSETPTVYTVVGFVLILSGFVLLKREALRSEVTKLRIYRESGD